MHHCGSRLHFTISHLAVLTHGLCLETVDYSGALERESTRSHNCAGRSPFSASASECCTAGSSHLPS